MDSGRSIPQLRTVKIAFVVVIAFLGLGTVLAMMIATKRADVSLLACFVAGAALSCFIWYAFADPILDALGPNPKLTFSFEFERSLVVFASLIVVLLFRMCIRGNLAIIGPIINQVGVLAALALLRQTIWIITRIAKRPRLKA